ncbi:MAG: hypothetical protein CMI09_14330 [Oceanospirillaceae bacterium]|nr:hypothetical protein [Oceanospirillaceae bacterium]|tara:strand:+ start:745 stop:999 length:255 start_codon:yes stop_codon:yes gene_type:complete
MDESQHYITLLEGRLQAAIELRPTHSMDDWLLIIQLVYDGDPAGSTSFTLHGYTREEAEAVAANVSDNAFLMKEIDEYLWGESD